MDEKHFRGEVARRLQRDPFDPDPGPPPAWDGTCTAFDPIPAGALCNGALCAVSLTSGPLVATQGECKPSTATLIDAGPPSWSSAVLACEKAAPYPSGCNGLYCAPRAAEAPGFLSCIFHDGAPCLCGPPDSSCSAVLSVFNDGACSPKPLFTVDLSSAAPICHDLPSAGVALGGKQLMLAYDAGSCAPSGGGAMVAGPSGASTFCCLGGA